MAIKFQYAIPEEYRVPIAEAAALNNAQRAERGDEPLTMHDFVVSRLTTCVLDPMKKFSEHHAHIQEVISGEPPPE